MSVVLHRILNSNNNNEDLSVYQKLSVSLYETQNLCEISWLMCLKTDEIDFNNYSFSMASHK